MSSRRRAVAGAAIIVWDPLIRVFHWTIAALFLTNFWLLEAGETAHEWVGYSIAALVMVRVVWGFVGPANARFASFWPTPARLALHWRALRSRSVDPAQGHNPLGALMILLLLSLLALTAVSGWMQGLDLFWGEDWVELLHEYTANTLMGAVVMHIVAVVVMSRYTGLGLIRTMITGRRMIASAKMSDERRER